MGNIIGEGFPNEIIDQINSRQKVYGSGFNQNRTPDEITYLNSNTAWCKLVSSTVISGSLTNSPTINGLGLKGDELARRFILFNGTATQNGQNGRAGIDVTNTSLGYNAAYGIGGTDFGVNPMPGIQSVTVKHKNRGSIRIANVKIKAFNKTQFEIVDILYLRLGFSVLLEWGNAMYFNNANPPQLQKNQNNSLANDFLAGKDYTEFLDKIQKQRIKSLGNYDAIFGKVTNFHWSFQPDGSYDITLDLISAGDVIESFKMNSRPTFNETTVPTSLDGALPKSIVASRNKHIMGQIFYELAAEIYNTSGQGSYRYISENPDDVDIDINGKPITNIKSFALTPLKTGVDTTNTTENGWMYYIRLGSLLKIIQNNVVYKLKSTDPGSTPQPILKFDYGSEDNLMNLLIEDFDPNLVTGGFTTAYELYPSEHVLHQVSYDPFICVTYQKFQDITRDIKIYKDSITLLQQTLTGTTKKEGVWTVEPISADVSYFETSVTETDKNGNTTTHTYGKIMNIFLNMEYVLDTFNSLMDESTAKIPLIDFLKKLLDGVTGAFGGINALDVAIDETKNTIKIIDKNPTPSPQAILNKFKLDDKTAEFSLYGYSDSQTNPRASFITDFRFTTELTPEFSTMIAVGASANGQAIGEDSTALSKLNAGVYDKYKAEVSDSTILNITPSTVGGTTNENLSNFIQSAFAVTPPGWQPAAPPTAGEEPKSFYQFLGTLYRDQLGGGLPLRHWNKSYCETFKSQIQNIYRYYYKWKTNSPSTANSGFIPFNLSLTMDGLSGMKIYQKYRVDTNFMPSNYPESMEFLIKNIEQKIEDNKWTTVLESFCVSKPSQGKPQASLGGSSATSVGVANTLVIDGDLHYDITPTYSGTRKTIIDAYGWPIIYKKQGGKYWGKLNGPVTSRNTYFADPAYESKNLIPIMYTSSSGKTYKYLVHKANQTALLTVLKTLDVKNLLPYTNIQANPNPRNTTGSPGVLSGHAFGLSVDVNSTKFAYDEPGYKKYLDAVNSPSNNLYKEAQVIKTFIDSGLFYWGGDFKGKTKKDVMHFTIKPYNI